MTVLAYFEPGHILVFVCARIEIISWRINSEVNCAMDLPFHLPNNMPTFTPETKPPM
jgi:hypothetical protein